MRTRHALPAAVSLALVALLARQWSVTRPAVPPEGVVIVTLDTTRADRLSPYGFMNVSLPGLERLAREGVVFDQVTSVAPLTLTAHASLFTGLLPPHHGVRDNADVPLAESQTTLAEILGARGFRTGAFVGSAVLAPDRGLRQGFDRYRGVDDVAGGASVKSQRPANEVIDDAIRWLDTIGQSRFFLWTHLYDAHRPYAPPEPYRSIYGHDLYVAEIAFADSQVTRLLDALEGRHLLDHVVVVVTADHGESLGSHGERDHGVFVYEDVLHVPLIVRAPGLRSTRVGGVARLTDVMPTVLDLLGVPTPQTDGVSLVDVMTDPRRAVALEAYAESMYPKRLGWSPLRALRDGRFKLIEAPRPELYDLEQDPFEERNIYAARPDLARAMTARLEAVASSVPSGADVESGLPSPDVRARLAALGYAGAAPARPSTGKSLPDPKDCIGIPGQVRALRLPDPVCHPRSSDGMTTKDNW